MKEKLYSLLKEFIKIYSNKKSLFSKKRIESSIAFLIGQIGMISFFYVNLNKLDIYDILLWSSLQFAIAGYILDKIEKSKKEN